MPVKKPVGKVVKKAAPTPTPPANSTSRDFKKAAIIDDNNEQTPSRNGIWPQLTELTEKHLYFCKRYVLNGGNAAKAGRESGYNGWYCAERFLKDSLIQQEIKRYQDIRKKKFEVNADRVIQELVKVAFGTLGDFVQVAKDGTPIIDCDEVGQEEMAALSEITQDMYVEKNGEDFDRVKKTKIKMHSKVAALEQLGRIFKLFGEGGDMDKDTPEQKALKIRAALRAMNEADGTIAS